MQYEPALVGFPASMRDKSELCIKPLCTFDAVMAAQTRQVLCGLGVLELCQMP